ncbi:MAG: hypothetical protein WBP59_05550 [Ilumatobacteraceae bacterium]
MLPLLIASADGGSRGSSGIGPVLTVIALTIASALVLSWVFHRLPGSDENTGASPFGRRRRQGPFDPPDDDIPDSSSNGPFGR